VTTCCVGGKESKIYHDDVSYRYWKIVVVGTCSTEYSVETSEEYVKVHLPTLDSSETE